MPLQVRRSDLPKHGGGLLAVSQSGETKDVHRAVKIGEESGMPCISVVNVVGSLIARTTGLGVYLNAGRECGVASTKAFTTQVRSGHHPHPHFSSYPRPSPPCCLRTIVRQPSHRP